MKPSIVALIILLLARTSSFADDKPPTFELLNGDRVVLIGGTMIERDQSYGYLETRLTRRYPDRNITFRNLGWSGDTVEGISRAGFGGPNEGYKQLVDHVLALKPTVVILGYGANESFEGKAGLPKFLAGLDKLLKAIESTKARLVFLSPTRQENLGPPLPDPTLHNADLALYRDALKAETLKRGAVFVDLFELVPDGTRSKPRFPLTSNGIHLTPYGYWRWAAAIEEALLPSPKVPPGEPVPFLVEFGQDARGFKKVPGGVQFRFRDNLLPAAEPPDGGPTLPGEGRRVGIFGLAPGRTVSKVDGVPVYHGDAEDWLSGVVHHKGPEFDQVEALRQAINTKNELYFYRWRPQNETYLFGFRKHEQGQNAREIPLFDPLVEVKETEIAKLRVPVPHLYELIREDEVGQ